MTTMHTQRSQRWFDSIYDSRIRMGREEYLYILALILAANLAFGLGLVLGLIWAWIL